MGQYTWYVWSSVGLVLASLAWLAINALWQHRQVRKQLQQVNPCR
ncbi:heme exporter protein CcmD [Candidatus Berkiella aquae]|uniref:Heme exporter protein D n=1 Tax=Candidatus Berkiella aquae TaxID=295108 RepID=A0A0Q9YVF9_9GAMM|nr:heme exporter protein CcmD [Candidatus Berkiella aquae]MCS5711398.1 heme exporter protein CcmD [Candidatus Berkiella aquae]